MQTFWTDGACFPNPGKGGWGWTNLNGFCCQGGESPTTNQRMEMTAVIDCLRFCKAKDIKEIQIISDSQYVINGAGPWRKAWERKKWRNSANKPVANKDLWVLMHSLIDQTQVTFKWVRGHSGERGNEEADRLAMLGSGCTRQEIEEAQNLFKRFAACKDRNSQNMISS